MLERTDSGNHLPSTSRRKWRFATDEKCAQGLLEDLDAARSRATRDIKRGASACEMSMSHYRGECLQVQEVQIVSSSMTLLDAIRELACELITAAMPIF